MVYYAVKREVSALRKCHKCQYCKTYADKKGVSGRLFTMVCTKDFPDTTVIDMYENNIDKNEWESLECIKNIED